MSKKYRLLYECPTEFAMDVLGGKWKTVILAYLSEQPMRYSELRALMPKLSEKVLTERLKDLAASDLVRRKRSPGANAVELYTLTERGQSLSPVLTRLYAWGNTHAKVFGVQVGAPLKRLRASTKLPSNRNAARVGGR